VYNSNDRQVYRLDTVTRLNKLQMIISHTYLILYISVMKQTRVYVCVCLTGGWAPVSPAAPRRLTPRRRALIPQRTEAAAAGENSAAIGPEHGHRPRSLQSQVPVTLDTNPGHSRLKRASFSITESWVTAACAQWHLRQQDPTGRLCATPEEHYWSLT